MEEHIKPYEMTPWGSLRFHEERKMSSQALAAPTPHHSSSSYYLTTTVPETSHQNCPTEPFLNSWLAETRKDNKMNAVILNQGSGVIFFPLAHWHTGQEEAPEWSRNGGGGQGYLSLCPPYFHHISSGIFSLHIWLLGSLPLYSSTLASLMRKALPYIGWKPLLLDVRPKWQYLCNPPWGLKLQTS